MNETTLTPEEFAAKYAADTITGYLIDVYKETADLSSMEPRPSDMCRVLNTRDHYVDIETIEMLSAAQTDPISIDLSSDAA